jgi:hypothetical protein
MIHFVYILIVKKEYFFKIIKNTKKKGDDVITFLIYF